MTKDKRESRWFEFDTEERCITYQQTEEHIFGEPVGLTTPIGEMDRDWLIHVIAMGYYERDKLSQALIDLADGKPINPSIIQSARNIVSRMNDELYGNTEQQPDG